MSAKNDKKLRRAARNFERLTDLELNEQVLEELGYDLESMFGWLTTAMGVLEKDPNFPVDELLPSKLLLSDKIDSLQD